MAPENDSCLISSINEHLNSRSFFLLTYQCHKPCGLHLGHTRLETKAGTHCGVEANISGKSFSFEAPYKEQGRGLACAHPPTGSRCQWKVEHTQSSTSMVSVSVWGERGRKELLLRGAGVKAGVGDRSVKTGKGDAAHPTTSSSPPPPLLAQISSQSQGLTDQSQRTGGTPKAWQLALPNTQP